LFGLNSKVRPARKPASDRRRMLPPTDGQYSGNGGLLKRIAVSMAPPQCARGAVAERVTLPSSTRLMRAVETATSRSFVEFRRKGPSKSRLQLSELRHSATDRRPSRPSQIVTGGLLRHRKLRLINSSAGGEYLLLITGRTSPPILIDRAARQWREAAARDPPSRRAAACPFQRLSPLRFRERDRYVAVPVRSLNAHQHSLLSLALGARKP
jgi:hypothetical protein